MADLYLTPAERYTAALGGFYYGDLPEPGTVYTQLIKDILDGSTPDKEPKNILARFIYSLYISDLGDPYPRYELAKLLYWKLHNITPTKSGSVLTVTIDGKEDYMTINTDLSRLWYKVLFGSKTDIITEFPYIFNTMQNKLSDWGLFGNVEVSGTPTPDNPVMPQGTGERTGNLWAGDVPRYSYAQDYKKYNPDNAIALKVGTYTISSDGKLPIIQVFNVNHTQLNVDDAITHTSGYYKMWDGLAIGPQSNALRTITVTLLSDCILTFAIPDNLGTYIMLNLGSTALPYEPYGYKIPISSANITTPVYLGEIESTRRIKKLVLDGTENWVLEYTDNFLLNTEINNAQPIQLVVCTHQQSISTGYEPNTNFENVRISQTKKLNFRTRTIPHNLSDIKSYLAAQYAAGTPVTVWYVLAEPETTVVNEPLMKIGGYADSMSRAQTGIDIPTVIGQNTLDVLTTVKPSSMSIEYTSSDENRSRSKRISLLKSPLKKGLIK